MTIKKRLVISNILMILVPVVITALIGLACVGMVWYTVAHGTGLGIEHNDDFYLASQGISKMAESALRGATRAEQIDGLTDLSQLLDKNAMSLIVDADGENLYRYGNSADADSALRSAINELNGEGYVSNGERELYAHQVSINGTIYRISIFASHAELSYGTLKVVVALAVIILLFGIFMSILLTNRFLTKFVFQKIERPLDMLSEGVRQIRDGNLDHRIVYETEDEFAPICSDFNEMAVRLKESVDLTQQHEQSRKELLAGISHDLRSPLTSIRAYVEGLLDGVPKTPEAQRSYLETIKNKAEDIDRLVEELFMFSKMELGEYPDHPKLLRLDDEIRQFVSSVGPEYSGKGLQIFTGTLSPATVSADPEQLRRVLVNILENSLTYKDKETGHLEISLQEEKGGFRLSLCDDGPGVPAESLPRLFDAFYRGDPARQNPNRGSGLGLSIVAGAIRRMNGKIHAEPGKDGGLAIVIWLPKTEG
ncbi:MAG: HAMP domain-containing sensor histidine kinase [Oscillospiraceae bacterium]|nr:HAMP domain-containing sensor histidine kinase [Oscillospiraceae bacterium]